MPVIAIIDMEIRISFRKVTTAMLELLLRATITASLGVHVFLAGLFRNTSEPFLISGLT
jgi:hypothetical protein